MEGTLANDQNIEHDLSVTFISQNDLPYLKNRLMVQDPPSNNSSFTLLHVAPHVKLSQLDLKQFSSDPSQRIICTYQQPITSLPINFFVENALSDLPNFTALHTKDLRKCLNLFYEHSQSLNALNYYIATESNPILTAHLLRKLDSDIVCKLEFYFTQTQ